MQFAYELFLQLHPEGCNFRPKKKLRRNHSEPEGNFQKFPEGEGDFCEFPTQNQEFKLNSGFYISSTVSKCKSHLCRPAGVEQVFLHELGFMLTSIQ